MKLKELMDKINSSIKNKSSLNLSNYDELINQVLKESDEEIKKVVELNNPKLWENIYKRRDLLKLKMDILNKIMSLSK